ncbi:MAG: hypothetical protein B6245_20540 [Desulfobacteraceae bacterium 4572_88]|nr:MAG: hypothetical protein B6245_20540 [Desulfobacteraceae bacterium 4572_88]
MPELAYVNGEILPIEEARVPIEDRGYQFGDAVYEVIASYDGRMFCLEEHLDRLEYSMSSLEFPEVPRERLRSAITELFEKAELPRAAVYVQISRGIAPRNHAFPDAGDIQFIITARAVKKVPPEYREEGVAAITMRDFRWARCDIKTTQLLPNATAKQKALEAGVYDTIFITEEDVVREATSSNVFIVSNGKLMTHPLTQNILGGITRIVILDICKEQGLQVEKRLYHTKDMYAADEVFLSGTITEIMPIVNIDKRPIGDGKVGPITRQLFESLRARMTSC